jgi:2-keto-4-pentenoate hydratase
MFRLLVLCFFLIAIVSGSVAAASNLAEPVTRYYMQRIQMPSFPDDVTLEEAVEAQAEFVTRIRDVIGPRVGYKAGLTNASVQQRFGVDQPLFGVMLQKMLLESGAVVDAKFGARPMHEGDLMVRVGSASINDAKTREEALAGLDSVVPFIELPDLLFAQGVKMSAPAIAAINVGARLGVMGTPIPLNPEQDWLDRLRNFELTILDRDGQVLAEGKGSNLLGHPLEVVLWLKDALAEKDIRLEEGDLLSLGTVTKLFPAEAGARITARYTGLDPSGPAEVSVSFE